jgi:hypothetical protein
MTFLEKVLLRYAFIYLFGGSDGFSASCVPTIQQWNKITRQFVTTQI